MPNPRKHIYLTGDRIGRLIVVGHVFRQRPDGRNRRLIECRCDCGNVVRVLPSNLGSGDTRSCGCLQKERAAQANTTHGGKARGSSKLINVWRGMRSRCYNPNAHNYRWYGGKGVIIEWPSFTEFKEWARTSGYEVGLQLDRIDRNGPYSPSNCWWVTPDDNLLRAGLHIDPIVDRDAVSFAQSQQIGFGTLIEQALRFYLADRG